MKRYSLLAFACGAGMLAFAATPARAQMDPAPPMVVKQTPPKAVWMKATVIHADSNSIVVSEQGNERMIHTFTYTPEVHEQMRAIIDQGGYQYGDKVKIRYMPGETVALRIRGNPSPAL
jgi:hypothetical protein